jgi:CRISPR-associated protein Csm2
MASQKQIQIDKDVEKIKNEIEKLTMLKCMTAESFAKEEGYADDIAWKLNGKLKNTQLRRFFDSIKEIERKLSKNKDDTKWEEVEVDFYLLKPKLAYARGRNLIPEEFYQIVKTSLNKVDSGDNKDKIESFKVFFQFLQSIIAYQKFYEGG